jgi:hypothetical protein
MTGQEYTQLVQSSESFQRLPAELQQKILAAQGAECEKYAALYVKEREMILGVKKDFVAQSSKMITAMTKNGKEIKKKALLRAEQNNRATELARQETLLKQI